MDNELLGRLLRRIGQPHLPALLSETLSASDLNSLLLDVFHCRSRKLAGPDLLRLYQQNRLSTPADLPVLTLKRMELDVLQLLQQCDFEPIELSPVTVLGACSVLGPVHQDKVLSALRGTEVLADSTNAIALHACDLRKRKAVSGARNGVWFRRSNIQRQLRTQPIRQKGFSPHFRVGCLVTCGTDTGHFSFETQNLTEHLLVMRKLFMDHYRVEGINFRLLIREGVRDSDGLVAEVCSRLSLHKEIEYTVIEEPAVPNHYYKGIQYKADIVHRGRQYEICDGGFVDWTQQLLQNRKERMLTTGFGFDLIFRILSGDL